MLPHRIEGRKVDTRPRRFAQAVGFDVRHHAHYFGPSWIPRVRIAHLLAERISVREKFPGEALVDDRNSMSIAAVPGADLPPQENRNPQGGKVAGTDVVHPAMNLLASLRRVAFDGDWIAGFRALEQAVG